MNHNEIFSRLRSLPGDVGFYYENLISGEQFGYREHDLFEAASVIKLPVYAAVMKLIAEGNVNPEEKLLCRDTDKLPSCGALQFFPGEFSLDIRTLCSLMITLSDNTAANLILRRFGLDNLNHLFRKIGLQHTRLERLLFDSAAAEKGLENRIVPAEIGDLLKKIALRSFISSSVSDEMENLLRRQQIRHKIPGYLPRGTPVANKTGEDTGITNDVGIVLSSRPYVLCFATNRTDVPAAERCIREISHYLYIQNMQDL